MTMPDPEFNLNVNEVRSAIDTFAHLPADTEPDAVRASAMQALTALSRQCKTLQAQTRDNPNGVFNAAVWLDGVELGVLAHKLAARLRQRELIELEEKAHAFRCVAVLAVQGHYRHVVGPAMIDRAECNERLGNIAVAVQHYQAVVADFSGQVEDWEQSAKEGLTAEDGVSVRCLGYAMDRLLALQPDADTATLSALRARCWQLAT